MSELKKYRHEAPQKVAIRRSQRSSSIMRVKAGSDISRGFHASSQSGGDLEGVQEATSQGLSRASELEYWRMLEARGSRQSSDLIFLTDVGWISPSRRKGKSGGRTEGIGVLRATTTILQSYPKLTTTMAGRCDPPKGSRKIWRTRWTRGGALCCVWSRPIACV